MVLQNKIDTFINRAQSKIAELSLEITYDLNESYADSSKADLSVELVDVITSLQDPLLDWTEQEIESVIDWYTTKAELYSIAIVNFEDKFTYISEDGESSDDSWVPSYNALNQKVDSNHTYVLGEIDRLDLRIDNLDFSNLVPQELIDEIDANTAARHTHDNKSILDSISQSTLDAIVDNTDHRNDGTVHVTNTQKQDWDSRVTQQELTDGLGSKADTVHEHEIEDVNGLSEALDGLTPIPGPPGDDGQSPVMQAGTIEDGEYSIDIDNTDPLNPILNLQVPAGVDGEDFHIDVFGVAGGRLDSQYDNVDEGYSYLGTDNGTLYFRRPFTDIGDPIPATSTQGWYSSQFMGYDGWSPILGVLPVDDTKTVLTLSGWTGGSGEAPVIGTPGLPVYLGPTGFTQVLSEATNIRGNEGPQGETGKAVFPDASGIVANNDRTQYDGEPADFMFYDTDTGLMYIKRSDTAADWSEGYQWKGDTGATGPEGPPGSGSGGGAYMDFIPQDPAPEYVRGRVWYDSAKDALSYYNDNDQVSLNLGQELVLKCVNADTVPIASGTPVVPISFTLEGVLMVVKANARFKDLSDFIGVATADMGVGATGYVTRFGEVGGVNTSAWPVGTKLYLSDTAPGEYSTTKPLDGSYAVLVGGVKVQDLFYGIITVDPQISDLTVEVTDTNGFPADQRENTYITAYNATRTFVIGPSTGTTFHFYERGEKYEKTGEQTIVFPDMEGEHWFYYENGVLVTQLEPTFPEKVNIVLNHAFIAAVFWDFDNKTVVVDVQDERHGISMSPATHLNLHLTRGAQLVSGWGLANFTPDGDGDLDVSAQFSVESGAYFDEDIEHTESGIAVGSPIPVVYNLGTEGNLRAGDNPNFAVLAAPAGRIYYNEWTGTTWQLTEVPNRDFCLYHIFTFNGVSRNTVSVMGQASYTSITAAREAASIEISNLTSSLPFAEIVPIATIIFETQDSYNNQVKSRIRTVDGENYIDWRSTELSQGTAPSNHSNLAGVNNAGTGVTQGHINNDIPLQLPELTTAERDAYSTPVAGMKIYNTTDSEEQIYDGAAWVAVGGGGETKPILVSTPFVSPTYTVDMDLNQQTTLNINTETAINIAITPPTDSATARTERELIINNIVNPNAISSITFDDDGGNLLFRYEDGDPVSGLAAGAALNITIINVGDDQFLIKTNPAYFA